MTSRKAHRPQKRLPDDSPEHDVRGDDYFARLIHGEYERPTPRRLATVLLIVGGVIALGAIALTVFAYLTDDPGGYDWQLVLGLTGPMLALSVILGGIGAYLAWGRGEVVIADPLRESIGASKDYPSA